MITKQTLVVGIIAAIIFLRFFLPRTAWFRRIYVRWLAFKVAWSLHKIKKSFDGYDHPKSKLKRARESVEALRSGYRVNSSGEKIYLSPGIYWGISGQLQSINEALEVGFSYKQLGTTKDEVIGFRNGEAHKASARLQLALSRILEDSPCDYNISELAKDGKFALEEIGTSEEELESLSREYSRSLWKGSVDRFRRWATGESKWHEDPDEFEREMVELLSPDGRGFSYADLETDKEECKEMMRLARRREVERWIDYLKHEAEKGDTNNSFAREKIQESLEKAGLVLTDFDLSESDLDEIERQAYVNKARILLEKLRTPGESWFYSPPSIGNPNVRSYLPGYWECIPGDPHYFVGKIKENLSEVNATLADINTNDSEIDTLVQAGHLASAKFLIQELEQVSGSPRLTEFEKVMSMFGQKTMFWDDPENPVDRTTLEPPYPIERDMEAIEYHLKGAGVELEEIGISWQTLQGLRTTIETR